jgi:branched-chain amino acid transport system ATP-binding protein
MKVCHTLADVGLTIIVAEQNIAAALALAHRIYRLNNGHIVEEQTAAELKRRPEILHRYLGVSTRRTL